MIQRNTKNILIPISKEQKIYDENRNYPYKIISLFDIFSLFFYLLMFSMVSKIIIIVF